MDGVHDLGGVQGFGPVAPELHEPVFHHDWERRVWGLNFAELPITVDQFRHAVERMDPVEYLNASYYERWLHAIETLAVQTGVLTVAELEQRRGAVREGAAVVRRNDPGRATALVRGVQRPAPPPGPVAPARFAGGDRVRVRRTVSSGHTRCPRYVRGAPGVVEALRYEARLPDASAAGHADQTEPLYSVRFAAADLWGEGIHRVYLDLWESYLEPGARDG